MAGDKDRQDPLEQHEREVLPRIPGAKLIVIGEPGHLIMIDQPEKLSDAIREFVLTVVSSTHSMKNCVESGFCPNAHPAHGRVPRFRCLSCANHRQGREFSREHEQNRPQFWVSC